LIPKDLIAQAETLAKLSQGKPKQANLRRSVSAAYYAVFHALCYSNANAILGRTSKRPEAAWLQAYRATDHGKAKSSCESAQKMNFPQDIKDFANAFFSLQEHRHRAGYNPDASTHFSKKEVFALIGSARAAVDAIQRAPLSDRRAFAIHVWFGKREKTR
jgi:hypothetical protein